MVYRIENNVQKVLKKVSKNKVVQNTVLRMIDRTLFKITNKEVKLKKKTFEHVQKWCFFLNKKIKNCLGV